MLGISHNHKNDTISIVLLFSLSAASSDSLFINKNEDDFCRLGVRRKKDVREDVKRNEKTST